MSPNRNISLWKICQRVDRYVELKSFTKIASKSLQLKTARVAKFENPIVVKHVSTDLNFTT